jgi:uncharacterized protein YdaU (DUF1376 family)
MEIGLHYYQFHINDYRGATSHLSNEEDLAYRRLIEMYYDTEQPIPLDLSFVSRRIRIEPEIILAVLEDFFQQSDEGWVNKRAEREIIQYHEKKDTASRAGKASAERRANRKTTEDEQAFNGCSTTVQPTNNHKPITNNQEPITIVKTSSGNGLLPCPHEEIIGLFHKVLPELPEVRVWNQTRQGYLKARWRELVAEHKWETKEQGLEWFEKFFTWVRASKFLMGKVPARPGARPFECELEWLLRPNNWAKLIEGKYHAA